MVSVWTDVPFLTVGLFLGLAVLAALGDGLYRLFRRARLVPVGRLESIGVRVVLSIAVVPWVSVLFDLTGIPITRLSFALMGAVLFGAGLALDRWKPVRGPGAPGRREAAGAPGGRPASLGSAGPSKEDDAPAAGLFRSPAALLLAAATASLVVFSVIHVSLIPVRNYDALVGYDLVGKIMALEGKYRSSVFTHIDFNAQCVYAPFTAANNGYWYIFQPAIPRLWVPLLLGGFTLIVWIKMLRWTGSPTAAGLTTFAMYLPSAFLFQLTVAQTDMPAMVFTALSAFSVLELRRGREGYGPAAVYSLAAATGRTENLLFGAALTAVVLLWKLPGRWRSVYFTALPAAFFVFWNLFFVRGLIGYDPGAYFLSKLDVDPGRLVEVFVRAGRIAADPLLFGEFIWAVVLTPVLLLLPRFVPGPWRSRTVEGTDPESAARDVSGPALVLCLAMFLLYMPFFYMWNEALNPLWSMEYTFKRGFLRFIPVLMAAFVATSPVLWLLRRCDGPEARKQRSGRDGINER